MRCATQISVVHLTPAMGQLLTANASASIPSLAVALFVGDVLTKRDVKRLQRLAPSVVTVNMYGTTETQRAVSFLVSVTAPLNSVLSPLRGNFGIDPGSFFTCWFNHMFAICLLFLRRAENSK